MLLDPALDAISIRTRENSKQMISFKEFFIVIIRVKMPRAVLAISRQQPSGKCPGICHRVDPGSGGESSGIPAIANQAEPDDQVDLISFQVLSSTAFPGVNQQINTFSLYFGNINCNCRRILEPPTKSGFSAL